MHEKAGICPGLCMEGGMGCADALGHIIVEAFGLEGKALSHE